ncbi:uncharacterized protein B0I36DRAFT_415127, partial [Microdochium trichocladiopsis]
WETPGASAVFRRLVLFLLGRRVPPEPSCIQLANGHFYCFQLATTNTEQALCTGALLQEEVRYLSRRTLYNSTVCGSASISQRAPETLEMHTSKDVRYPSRDALGQRSASARQEECSLDLETVGSARKGTDRQETLPCTNKLWLRGLTSAGPRLSSRTPVPNIGGILTKICGTSQPYSHGVALPGAARPGNH